MTQKSFTVDHGLEVTGTGGDLTLTGGNIVGANVLGANSITTTSTGGDITMTGGNITGVGNIWQRSNWKYLN